MGCHDTAAARSHMGTAGVGGASVGDFTQAQWLRGAVFERCAECHGPGGGKDVRTVHGID
jgi:mono/diheme cytochrome c family protein